jgi:hypothetical protein
MKEMLTSALLAQTQQDSLATMDQDEALPVPTYSETKDPVKPVESVAKMEGLLEVVEKMSSGNCCCQTNKPLMTCHLSPPKFDRLFFSSSASIVGSTTD